MEECEPCDVLDLETEYRELDALPVVDTIRSDKGRRPITRHQH